MKTILTYAIIALLILGCGENDMAKIAEECNSTLVTTNVTDTTPTYDSDAIYENGDIVQDNNNIYVISLPPTDILEWESEKEYKIGDIVSFENDNYIAINYDMLYTPTAINTSGIILGAPPLPREYDSWFFELGEWEWDYTTETATITKTTSLGITTTWVFTIISDYEYNVNITVGGGTPTDETWTIYNTFSKENIVGSWFIYNGLLHRYNINTLYKTPDSVLTNRELWQLYEIQEHTLTEIGATNQYKPFDGQNITPAISTSPMTYTIKADEPFNSFTLAKVKASQITYTFKNSSGTTIKTDTATIDLKRDELGILSDYPTTVTFYANQQMEANSTVEITLTYDDEIELGDFTLNNSVDSGFTNLTFSHGIKDYNDYTPDAFGNIPESVKAIVTTFDVTVDVPITNYDYMVSFLESIAGKNVTIDGSDSNGEVADSESVFASLTRRVRVVSPNIATKVKDNSLDRMATLKFKVQEIA